MANITEELNNPQWVEGIYQLETTDPVLGGPNGIANRQAKELAARTQYLKKKQEEYKPSAASTTKAGIVQLSSATNSDNEEQAATPKAVKAAYDKAVSVEIGINKILLVGRIDLLPFRPEDLRSGWYHANGDRYGISTAQGEALLALPEYYRTAFNIAASGGFINLPNMYHNDGRGYFLRASKILGEVQTDAFQGHRRDLRRNSGADSHMHGYITLQRVPHNTIQESNAPTALGEGDAWMTDRYYPDGANGTPRVAAETRPLNIGFTPAIYLGV